MLIACKFKRPKAPVELDGNVYFFVPIDPANADSEHVADVENSDHIQRLLGIPEAYYIARAQSLQTATKPVPPVAPVAEQDSPPPPAGVHRLRAQALGDQVQGHRDEGRGIGNHCGRRNDGIAGRRGAVDRVRDEDRDVLRGQLAAGVQLGEQARALAVQLVVGRQLTDQHQIAIRTGFNRPAVVVDHQQAGGRRRCAAVAANCEFRGHGFLLRRM